MRRSAVWVLGLGLAAVLAGGGILAWTLGGRSHGADPTNPEQVALGWQVYAARCASCHGDQLQGQPNWQVRQPNGRLPAPPHDDRGHTWHHPDTVLFSITQQGIGPFAPPGYQSDMTAFGDTVTDEEIWAVLAFQEFMVE